MYNINTTNYHIFKKKKQHENNIYQLIQHCNDTMQKDIEELNKGNQKIDEIERKILICKKKLKMKKFNK